MWIVYKDGKVSADNKAVGQLTQKEVDSLIKKIEDSGFFDYEHPEAGEFCCDFFTVTIAVSRNGITHSVSLSDGDPEAPNEIIDLHSFLVKMLSS